MQKVFDKYKNPYRFKAHPQMPKSKTEQTGNVPLNVRVEEMIMAGQRLNQFRKEHYDSDVDYTKVTPGVPITRRRGIDFMEIFEEGDRLNAKWKKQQVEEAKVTRKKQLLAEINEKMSQEDLQEALDKIKPIPSPVDREVSTDASTVILDEDSLKSGKKKP